MLLGITLLAAYVTDLRYLVWDSARESGSAPTWYRITGVGYTITGYYPFIAAFGAWLGSRGGRRRTTELEGGERRFGIGSSAPRIVAMAGWTTVSITMVYLTVAYITWQRAMDASGRGPVGSVPWQGALVIYAALIATACWGYLLGAILPRAITPLIAAGAIYLIFQIPLTFPELHWTRQVIPYDVSHSMAPFINDDVHPQLLGAALLWTRSQ